jgi:hypothetical protein
VTADQGYGLVDLGGQGGGGLEQSGFEPVIRPDVSVITVCEVGAMKRACPLAPG